MLINGNVTITPAYAGRAPGLTGVDQVNFTLPSNVPTACVESIQLVVDGVKSQPTTFMAIAPSGASDVCVQPGFTTAQLRDFDNGASVTNGGFVMSQFTEDIPGQGTVKIDTASGGFTKFTGFELASIPPQGNSSLFPVGTCIVSQSSAGGNFLGGAGISLDAGTVNLNGPAGSNITNMVFTKDNNSYTLNIGYEGISVPLPGFGNGKIVAGTYQLHGTGGTGVNAFDASITLGSPLTIIGGLPTNIVRANGIPLSWTGGNPTDLVEIFGSTSQVSGTSVNSISFVCYTTAGQGGFNVPADITNQLFAVSKDNGSIGVASSPFPASGNGLFNFTTVGDGASHQGTFIGLVGTGGQAAYQ